jgi:hypothetical protein
LTAGVSFASAGALNRELFLADAFAAGFAFATLATQTIPSAHHFTGEL